MKAADEIKLVASMKDSPQGYTDLIFTDKDWQNIRKQIPSTAFGKGTVWGINYHVVQDQIIQGFKMIELKQQGHRPAMFRADKDSF